MFSFVGTSFFGGGTICRYSTDTAFLYSVGDLPVSFLNTRLKWLKESNPIRPAISKVV